MRRVTSAVGFLFGLLAIVSGLAAAEATKPSPRHENPTGGGHEFCGVVDESQRLGSDDGTVRGSGVRSILAITVDFQNAYVAPETFGGSDPVASVAAILWDAPQSVSRLFEETSGGQLVFARDSDLDGQPDVIHVDVDQPINNQSCPASEWAMLAEANLPAGIDVNDYQHIMYVLPYLGTNSCWWGGLANVGCGNPPCRSWLRTPHPMTYAHELGHNLGMLHASSDPDNDGVVDLEYGDHSDMMGSPRDWTQLNAPHRLEMGWLPETQIIDHSGFGNQIVVLDALETDPDLAVHPQVLRIANSGSFPANSYFLSYRRPVGYGVYLDPSYLTGVSVHTYPGPYGRTLLVAGLDDLGSFEDPISSGLKVTQLVHDEWTVTLSIEQNEPDLDGDGFGAGVDCDDTSPVTYPGAASAESAVDCMRDADDDGWGDPSIGPGIVPGNDCNDASAATYPGAAPNDDANACMTDEDGDDWGAQQPAAGADPGSDCDDGSAACSADCGDLDGDGVAACRDNCLDLQNADQDDADSDNIGDACDNCRDAANPDQSDFDADGDGDVCEVGARLADADRSSRVDGFDLARLARAFGSCAPGPACSATGCDSTLVYDVTVDFDRNCAIDGSDLGLLGVWFGQTVVPDEN